MIERWSFAAAGELAGFRAWSDSRSIVSGPNRVSPNLDVSLDSLATESGCITLKGA